VKNGRILLVEDHQDTAAMMTRLLRQHGYVVLTANSVSEGVRLGEASEFDVLLTDLQLPDGWGTTLVEHLRRCGRSFMAVAVTGHGTRGHVADTTEAGFCAHLTKPVDFKLLLDTLDRRLESAAA
jgi:two-component system CheB/CheR fusion protein